MAVRQRVFSQGGISVVLDGELEAYVEAMLDEATKAVVSKMEDEMEAVLDAALKEWPTKSGRSKAGFKVVTKISRAGVEVSIVNSKSYAHKIRYSAYTKAELDTWGKTPRLKARAKRVHGEGAPNERLTMKSVWSELIAKPTRKLEKKLAKDLEKELLGLSSRI